MLVNESETALGFSFAWSQSSEKNEDVVCSRNVHTHAQSSLEQKKIQGYNLGVTKIIGDIQDCSYNDVSDYNNALHMPLGIYPIHRW